MTTQKNKYYALSEYLTASNKEEVVISRSELEKILGFKLPQSSRLSSWWANDSDNGHSQARGWVDAGYFVKTNNTCITFRRNHS